MNLQKPSQDMLYRYTQRKLSEEEEAHVELWLMEQPEALAEVQLDGFLHSGAPSHRSSRSSFFIPRWLHGLAYTALAVVAIYPHFQNQSGEHAAAPVNIVSLSQLRSADDGIALLSPNSESAIVIQAPVGYMSTETYDATLTRDGTVMMSTSALQSSSADLVSIMIGAGKMKSGEYRLELTGTSSGKKFIEIWRVEDPND